MKRRTRIALVLSFVVAARAAAQQPQASTPPPAVTAVKAGRLVDPETGKSSTNQVILVEGEKIKAVGAALAIPAGATVIDLSDFTVLPGLVDAHTHLGLTYKDVPEHDYYYLTYVMDSTPLRAIQAASNGIQLLNSGFTVVRDLGNNALYTDTAHRVAIDQGWIPGPTMVNSGLIIGGKGGQFWPTPEMAKQHGIVYPEYLEADTPDEIVKAVRENMLFGAKVIKICVDCKPWGYTVDEMKLFVSRGGKGRAQGGRPRPDARGRDARDRGRDLLDRARDGAHRGAPQGHGAEGHLPRLDGHALHAVPRHEGRHGEERRAAPERLEERRQGHVLDGHGLLHDRQPDEPR